MLFVVFTRKRGANALGQAQRKRGVGRLTAPLKALSCALGQSGAVFQLQHRADFPLLPGAVLWRSCASAINAAGMLLRCCCAAYERVAALAEETRRAARQLGRAARRLRKGRRRRALRQLTGTKPSVKAGPRQTQATEALSNRETGNAIDVIWRAADGLQVLRLRQIGFEPVRFGRGGHRERW